MIKGRFHAICPVLCTFAIVCTLQLCCVTCVNALAAVTTKTPIVACASSTEINRAISFYVQPGDCVLELGAQLTETSTHLCRTIGEGGRAHLVDIKRSDAKSGRCGSRDVTPFIASSASCGDTDINSTSNDDDDEKESFIDRVQFEELDQFDQWRVVVERSSCQVIILDVGTMIGNDLYLTALSICNELIALSSSPPRAVIVKSKTLSSLARRIIHSQRLLDGSVSILQSQLHRTNEPFVIPCVGVNEYRRTIPHILKPGDDVIEVGCHFGRTTTLLNDAVNADSDSTKGFCIGVDIGPKIVATARKEHPSIPFEVVDAWKTLELLKVKVNHTGTSKHDSHSASTTLGYDAVYADIGGLSGANGLLESLALLDALGNGLEPSCIVIKSLCMNRLASQLVAFSNVWNKINKSPNKGV